MKLAFRLGSIPVRVHGSFLIVVAFLGMGPGSTLAQLALWLAIVFIGVLLHELGHALVGRSLGLTPQIDLIGFGGLTSWSGGNAGALGPAKRIAISLAGPFTGIAIGAATMAMRARAGLPLMHESDGGSFDSITSQIVWVNAGWGVLNLLPILPLDGGNVLFQLMNRATGGRGEKPARYVSSVVAVAVGLLALYYTRQVYSVLLAGLFAVQNIQALRATSAVDRDGPLREVLKNGFAALERGDSSQAVRAGNEVLAGAAQPALRADAIRLLAFGYLMSGAWAQLMELMTSPAASAIGDDEMTKFEQAARELGHPDEAARIAEIRTSRRAPAF